MDLQILPPSQKILVGEVNMVVHAVSLSDLGRHPVLGGPRAIPAQCPQSWELFQWRTSTVATLGGHHHRHGQHHHTVYSVSLSILAVAIVLITLCNYIYSHIYSTN